MSDTFALEQVHVRQTQRPAVAAKAEASVTRASRVTPSVLTGALVVAVAFGVYLATMAPDLYSLDSPELTAAAHSLGIAHAPGYPLYTLSGWLFSHLFPVSSVAFRMNLLSGIFGAAACGVVYVMALRLTSRHVVAAAGALALGFSYYFWLNALAAEVYTLDALLFAAIILAAAWWRDEMSVQRAAVVGLLVGLSLSNRTSTALVLPALLAFVWMSGERSPKAYAAAGAGLLAGLAFYLYLPLRSAAGASFAPGEYRLDGTLVPADLATWSGFWSHVSADQFQSDVWAYSLADLPGEIATFGGWLAGSFLLVGLPLGVMGIIRLWQRDRALSVLLMASALPIAAFFISYGAIDKRFMVMPIYIVWSLWMVVGLDWALELGGIAEAPWLAFAALGLPVLALFINWPLVNLHNENRVRTQAEETMAGVQQNAIVYGRFSDVAPLQYLQTVEDQRPDVKLVNNWTAKSGFLVELAAANVGRVPFYITQQERQVCAQYACVPSAGVFEVRPRGGG